MTGAQRALTATTMLVVTVAMLALLMSSIRFRVPEPEVHVSNASVEILASRESATAYFVLRTNNDPTKLVEISSPLAKVVELRASGPDASQKIRAVETTFSPDQPLTFSRGGKHAVLRDLSHSVKPGEEILMTFHVEPAEPLTVRVLVRQAGHSLNERRSSNGEIATNRNIGTGRFDRRRGPEPNTKPITSHSTFS